MPYFVGDFTISSSILISASDKKPKRVSGLMPVFFRMTEASPIPTPFILLRAYSTFNVPSRSFSAIRVMCLNSFDILGRPLLLWAIYVSEGDFI